MTSARSKRRSTLSPSKRFSNVKIQSVNIWDNQTRDSTPLDPTINKNQQLTSDVQAVKYSFQSSNSMTPIYGKSENDNRRKIILFNWQNSYYYKALGCVFAMAACSLGIAALIFAIISYRNTLPGTTISTTTSTTSTTTTTTTTSTETTTSTTTVSTTTTTSVSTSTTSTSATTMCSTTRMTTIITAIPLPSQCSSYVTIDDGTRLAFYSGSVASCDQSTFSSPKWVRFTGESGVSLANCPVILQHYGANVTGWYSGIYPAIAGDMTQGMVCFNWDTDTCNWQTSIQIINCNGYYIYELPAPPVCISRYCTI